MSAIISALGALLQASSNTSTTTAFFHDLLQLYIPVGGHVELRSPIGDIPPFLLRAVHQTQRGTITISVGDRRNAIPKKKLQILNFESEDALVALNREGNAGFTPLAESHIVMLLPPGYTPEKITMAMNLCWGNSFGTCLAVIQPERTVQGVYDFYYSPLKFHNNKRCVSLHASPSRVNQWIFGKGFQSRQQTTQESIRDFQGCLVLIAPNLVQPYFFPRRRRRPPTNSVEPLSHFGGLDAFILSIIAEKFNLTVRVLSSAVLRGRTQNSEDGDEEMQTFAVDRSNTFIAVLQNDADIVAGGYVPTQWRFRFMHVTRAYASDKLMWYTSADEDVSWARLTMCFTATVWVLLVVAFCTTAALRLLIAPKENDSHPIVTLWGLSTESGRHPKYRNSSEVVLSVAWIIFSLHVNSAYRAGLATSLAAGPLYDDITDNELYTSDFTLYLPLALEGIVRDLLHEHSGQRFHCSSDKQDCIYPLQTQERIAILMNANLMMAEVPRRLMDFRTGQPTVRVVPGNVLSYPIQMYMSKGHMLRPYFDDMLQRITGAGFPKRFMSMWRSRRRRKHKTKDDVPLTLHHLEGAFILLFAGLATAFTVALFETLAQKSYFTRLKASPRLFFNLIKRK